MKILCAEYSPDGEAAIVAMGDDVLLRNNGDFYLPDYSPEVSCVPQLVVRLSKLGKSVHERFAARYFNEAGVGIRFYADSYEEELRRKSLPLVVASSFDSSAAISPMYSLEGQEQLEYAFSVNGQEVYRGNSAQMPFPTSRLVALASDFHTLKIGDFLFCGGLFRYRGLCAGDRLRMSLDGKLLLDFKIR